MRFWNGTLTFSLTAAKLAKVERCGIPGCNTPEECRRQVIALCGPVAHPFFEAVPLACHRRLYPEGTGSWYKTVPMR